MRRTRRSYEWWITSDPAFFLLLWLGSDLKATKYCSEARFLHVNYWRDLLLDVGLMLVHTPLSWPRGIPPHPLLPEPELIIELH